MSGNSNRNSPDPGIAKSNVIDSSSAKWHTGYIQGNTFSNKEVKYRIINGTAIFEGDIILASTPKDVERLSRKLVKAAGIKGEQYRWLRGEIPYVIQPTLPNQQRVTDAIRHWEEKTPIRFVLRTDPVASYYPNYVSFKQYVPAPHEILEEVFHCSSPIGMLNRGEQSIILSDQCATGDVIHEIGHTVGLWHEQSREDRDKYIQILWQNVQDGSRQDGSYNADDDMRHNFTQHVNDGDDIGGYDYCSIMHYGAWYFSKNRQQTIEILRPDLECANANQIGQKNGLSPGDIRAVIEMYGYTQPTVIQNPDGRLEVFVVRSDGSIHHKRQTAQNNSKGWDNQWSPLGIGAGVATRPLIARNPDNTIEVFYTYNNNFHSAIQKEPNSAFLHYTFADMRIGHLGDPAMGRDSQGRLEVFYTDETFRKLHYSRQQSDDTMDADKDLGGSWSLNRRATVAQNANGTLDVFMIDMDLQLLHKWQTTPNDNTKWSDGWDPLGGPMIHDPAVGRNADGRLELFKIDYNNRLLYQRWQTTQNDSKNWSDGWNLLGGDEFLSRRRPTVAQNADGRLELFTVGLKDRRLYHRWQTTKDNKTGKWSWSDKWEPLEGTSWPLSSNPVVARNANGTLDIFMVGMDDNLVIYHRWQTTPNDSTKWSSWVAL